MRRWRLHTTDYDYDYDYDYYNDYYNDYASTLVFTMMTKDLRCYIRNISEIRKLF